VEPLSWCGWYLGRLGCRSRLINDFCAFLECGLEIAECGLGIVDCGLRVKAVYNAFGGVWSDFLGAFGVSGRLAHKSLLVGDF